MITLYKNIMYSHQFPDDTTYKSIKLFNGRINEKEKTDNYLHLFITLSALNEYMKFSFFTYHTFKYL